MNLRIKILGFISAMTIATIIVLYVCLKLIVISNSTDVETHFGQANINRISGFISYQLDNLDRTNRSWAEWNEGYEYTKGNLPEFEKDELNDSMFSMTNTDLVAYINTEGKILYFKQYDMITKEYIAIDRMTYKFIEDKIRMYSKMKPGDKMSGISFIGSTPALVSARPILLSDGTGPSAGTVIMIKFINEVEQQKLATLLKSDITIMPVNNDNIVNFKSVDMYTEQDDPEYQFAYVLERDCEGKPSVIIESKIKRLVYELGQKNLKYFLFAICFICFMLCISILWLLEKNILSKVTNIIEKVDQIEETEDLSIRLNYNGKDEMSRLAGSMNKMLETIEKSQEQLEFVSMHDQLTGLYNRTSFEKEIERIKRDNIVCITIMICDVDGLKTVNDTLGHKKGDILLINVASLLKKCFRAEDKLFRIGGDEFAAIIRSDCTEFANSIYSRIYTAIDEFNEENKNLPISISVGFACSNNDCTDINELFKQADDKMYIEKGSHHQNKN